VDLLAPSMRLGLQLPRLQFINGLTTRQLRQLRERVRAAPRCMRFQLSTARGF
jgi:hypothetical protein